jgi:hypothetical protein
MYLVEHCHQLAGITLSGEESAKKKKKNCRFARQNALAARPKQKVAQSIGTVQ